MFLHSFIRHIWLEFVASQTIWCAQVYVCARHVRSHEGISVQLVIFLALIPLSAAEARPIGCICSDIQCSDTLGDNEWLITWINDRHTKNKCLFGGDLSLIYTLCISLSDSLMLKMTLLAAKKKHLRVICTDGPGKASAFVVVIQRMCLCVSVCIFLPTWTLMHFPTCHSTLHLLDFEKACHNEAKPQENQHL